MLFENLHFYSINGGNWGRYLLFCRMADGKIYDALRGGRAVAFFAGMWYNGCI